MKPEPVLLQNIFLKRMTSSQDAAVPLGSPMSLSAVPKGGPSCANKLGPLTLLWLMLKYLDKPVSTGAWP